jgi:hypothetical protein
MYAVGQTEGRTDMTKLRGPFRHFATDVWKDEREDDGNEVLWNCWKRFTQQHTLTARKTTSKQFFSVEVLVMKYSVQQAVQTYHAVTLYTEYGWKE